MILLIALRIPALAFCECEQEITLSNHASCQQDAAEETSSCACCETVAEEPPCENCIVVLSLDPGDFNWSSNTFEPKEVTGGPLAHPAGLQDDLPPRPIATLSAGSIRGSPPSGPFPAYLRTQVLRL